MTRCTLTTAQDTGTPRPSLPRHDQRGVALVVALVFLLMLTILGVTVMQTSSLEGRMAGNMQEVNRAFHAAESAIEHVFVDGSVFANLIYPGATEQVTLDYPTTNPNATVLVDVTYAAKKNKMPRARDRENIDSALSYGAAVFELRSDATTRTNANTVVLQGVAQATPKND